MSSLQSMLLLSLSYRLVTNMMFPEAPGCRVSAMPLPGPDLEAG